MLGVKEMQRVADSNKDKLVRLYNPDTDDFTCNWHGDPYTIHALEMEEYPTPIADHLKKHLADYIFHKRGTKVNAEDDLKAIFKEIEVEIE